MKELTKDHRKTIPDTEIGTLERAIVELRERQNDLVDAVRDLQDIEKARRQNVLNETEKLDKLVEAMQKNEPVEKEYTIAELRREYLEGCRHVRTDISVIGENAIFAFLDWLEKGN